MVNNLPKLSLTLILFCLLSSLSVLIYQENVKAQQQCPDIPSLSMPQWRPGATITVYFDENYQWSDATITALKGAFLNWNAANGPYANNSGVKFVGFQRGPYPDRDRAKDVYIVTRDPNSPNTGTANVANPVSGRYAAYAKTIFPTSLNLEPPSYDLDGASLRGVMAQAFIIFVRLFFRLAGIGKRLSSLHRMINLRAGNYV